MRVLALLLRNSHRIIAAWIALLAVTARAADAATAPGSAPPSAPAPVDQVRPAERFLTFFAPPQTDIAALSPDGRLLAYSYREAGTISVVVVEIDNPKVIKARVPVLSDRQATPAVARSGGEPMPARINWMRWATPTRLVLETNRVFATLSGTSATSEWASIAGEVIAFDADGSNARTLADAKRVSRMRDTPPPSNTLLLEVPDAFSSGATSPESTAEGAGGVTTPGVDYRPPRVLGFDPASPESLLVLGYAPPGIGRYSFNVSTGRMRYLDEEFLDPRMTMLLDRAGRPRIGIEYSTNKKLPIPFLLETGKFGRPWRKLDDLAGGVRGFEMNPDTYFGERSVPLALDAAGETLYYASNVGRDTFGIYSLDLKSGRRKDAAFENPALDLWEPAPGTFPDLRAAWYSEQLNLDAIVDAANAAIQETAASSGTLEGPDTIVPQIAPALETQQRSRVSASILPSRNSDDRVLVFDRYTDKVVGVRMRGPRPTTQWLQPELNEAQVLLEKRFQPNTVEIREWDRSLQRMLVSVSGPTLSGSFHVFDRPARSLSELAPRAPWLAAVTSTTMLGIAFDSPQGVPISGIVTVPRAPRVKPIPAVFITPRLPWQSFDPVYRVEVQAIADMGYVVVEYSGRGAWGRGRAIRERIHDGYEDAQVEDLLATVDYVAKHFAISPRRIAVMGNDHGGHVAVRALELAPGRFRCAVAVNAPVNLRTWLGELEWTGASAPTLLVERMFGDRDRQKSAPLVRDLEKIERPALLFNFRGPLGSNATNNYTAAKQFALSLSRRVPATEIVDIDEDYMLGLPLARAKVFARIEEFLNANMYDYTVRAGELEVDEPKPQETPAP